MGKRRRNERQILGNPTGPENFHYCGFHNVICTPVREWPGKKIKWVCKAGCNLSAQDTVLKPKPATKRR